MIITGASSGIGSDLALQAASLGAKVALAARSERAILDLEKTILQAGGHAFALRTDVTQPAEIRRLIDSTLTKWQRLDILINNAGYGIWGTFDQLPMDLIRQNFETNVFAAIDACQAVIPILRRQGGGMIVNIESIVGLRAMPMASCYSATKHALHAFSESIRLELRPDHIHILSVCPGLIQTNFHANRTKIGTTAETGPKWLYMPVDVCVRKILRAMENEQSRLIITGHGKLLTLMQRISPCFVDFIIGSNYRRSLRREKRQRSTPLDD